jgi:hypothetical protein
LPGLPPSSTGARAKQPCNPLTPASYRPGFFLAIDNNQGKEKAMNDTDTYRDALDLALDDLITLLKEAQVYLYSPEYKLAAIGTLTSFADKADDVKAALRLYTNSVRRQK